MRTVVGIIVCVVSSPLSAQWLNYRTPGIPRLPDGKPNLTAPAPRTSDGKPDLSGIWGLPCPVGTNEANGFNGQPNVYCATEVAVPREFANIGQSIKEGALSALGGRAGEEDEGGQPPQRSDEPLSSTRDLSLIHI